MTDISGSISKSYTRTVGNSNSFNETNQENNYSVDRLVYDLKIILVGNSGVGKTSLLGRFLGNEFDKNYQCTISAETKAKKLNIDMSTSVNLKIWDTCGQEKYRSLTRSFFRDAHGILLIYDVSDKKSFNDLNIWLKEIKENSPKTSSILLVGNKIDLSNRVISNQEANDFAIKNKIQYVEVSCLEGRFIETPFQNLSNEIVNKIKNNEIKIEDDDEDDEKELEIRISDNQAIEKEIGMISKKERKREKEVTCCL